MNIIKNIIKYSISLVARCLPINRRDIVFASYPDFSDNAWVLYNYLKETRHDLRLFWVVNQNTNISDIDQRNILRYYGLVDRIRTLWRINRAGFILSTHGVSSPKIKSRNQKNIYLNHGGCPIKGGKSFRYSHPSHDFKVKIPYDYVLCRGKESVKYQALFSCCEENKILPLGMMRDDVFIKNIGNKEFNPFYDGISKKLVIWMPTFRKSIDSNLSENNSATDTGLPLMEKEEDVVFLDYFLKKNDIQLLIKIHPLQEENSLFSKKFSNITIITNGYLQANKKQLYEIIGYSDALVSDYSSVYFDYLITDKPVGFILDDYNKYEQDRGFVFENPKEIMAGHHIYNFAQLKQFLLDVIEGKDEYMNKRHLIKQKYVGDVPECTCKKILEYFNI